MTLYQKQYKRVLKFTHALMSVGLMKLSLRFETYTVSLNLGNERPASILCFARVFLHFLDLIDLT